MPTAFESSREKKRGRPLLCYVTGRATLATGGPVDKILSQIELAMAAGVDWVQVREKDLPARELLALVCGAVGGAHEAARVLVNDRLDVALAAGAAGVHLGGESLPVREAVRWRRQENAPDEFLIGASCHRLEEAQEAESAGASYVFFGPVFDTPAKRPYGPPQGAARLAEVCRSVRIPVIAIGGIQEANAAECIQAGATGIAAIRMFQQPRDAREMRRLITRLHSLAPGESAGHRASGRWAATPRRGRKSP